MATKATTLGLSAGAAETIRDFLRTDVEDLKRDLADLRRSHSYTAAAIDRLANHIVAIDKIALDLLAGCIEGNSKTFIEKVS